MWWFITRRRLFLSLMSYAERARAPRTLTRSEVASLLRCSGQAAAGYRDHMLFSVALATGLRESELLALNCGDVLNASARPRARIVLRVFKRSTDSPAPQEVMVPDKMRNKLGRFMRWKRARGESCGPDAPLFIARGGRRLSKRRAREAFGEWRDRAGLSESLTFHALRHTFCQRLYDKTGDIRLVQRAARHATIMTTTIYAEPSADQLADAVQDVEC